MHANLPSGTVTFLFTDIEGSTQLWEHHPEAMGVALARHDGLLHSVIEANHGQVIKSTGDGLYAVFASAADGVNAAVASQRALHAEAWPVTGPLRVRMALHTGEAELREGDYFGPTLNRTARLMAVGAGGQCLLSQATAALLQEQLPAQVTLRDLGEHRLKDLVRPEHVYQLAVPDLPAEFPPLKSLNTYRHNLPVQLTSFVGREQEIEEIRRLLGSTRLLTLTGPGGTGKTRLALEVGTAALPMFADGVWLVELAPLTDGALAAETVASVFDLTQAKRPPMSALTSHLRDKHLLLILDNCEHLIQASAELAESLLRACAGLQILTTSRERLGITGEVVWPVASLNSTAALQLFEERAKAARPGFSLSGQNATTVSQICTRLDGIPLAIELAASRLGVLPVEQIAARLDDRFRLLTGGSRTALPRHRTLLALIDWSYDLLSEEEQRLLRRLSIFANGWTLEAAEEIYGSADALESLSQLVNKSLVVLDDQGRYARYRLLETIRQYAQEKLTEMGERESACQCLLEWCTDLAETANPHLGGPQEDLWLERMESEIDNLRAALEWALGSQKSEEALRLAAALGRFWGMRGHLTEGREWLRQALAVGDGASKAVQNEARIYAASMARKQGDYEAATDYLRESLEQSRQLGNKGAVARVLNSLGRVADEQGDQVTARTLYEESLSILREVGDEEGMAQVVTNLGVMANREGDYARARELLEEAIAICRKLGHMEGITNILTSLAYNAIALGEFSRAWQWCSEGLAYARKSGYKMEVAYTLLNLGLTANQLGKREEARASFSESLTLLCELGDKVGIPYALTGLATLMGAQGRAVQAAQLQGAVVARLTESGTQLERVEKADYDKTAATLRAVLGEAAYRKAFEAGQALPPDQAIELALSSRG